MFKLLQTLFIICLIIAGIFFWNYSQFENTVLTQEAQKIQITGGGFQSALIDAGANPLFTKIYLSNNLPDFELQKGSYNIPANANIQTYLESLKNPINETDISLTFLEGWNIFDIDAFLVQEGYIHEGEFIDFAENHTLGSEYEFLEGIDSLEGYLYPDTYAINPNTFSVESLARKMLDNFFERVFLGYVAYQDSNAIFEIITLASIVEKEEKNPDEKATVAGILKKRLDENWMIGADITVCYAHRLTSEECKLSVTKYLYDKNDYNTRQKVGLPAGPIGNPSEETLKATLYHKDSPYYYYLHDTSNGQIYYGRNEAEHNRNKQLYIR